MNIKKFPKVKKNVQLCNLKRSESQQLLNKTTKRKPSSKKLSSTLGSRTTLTRSASNTKLIKCNKKSTKNSKTKSKPIKNKQNKQPCQANLKASKKNIKKSKQKQEQLTERKKLHLEYFMYKDVYLPIQNTEQRKLVYKIRLIDESEQKIQPNLNRLAIETDEKSTEVESVELVDKATQPTDRKLFNIDYQCQTQQNRESFQKSQQSQKCFAETLSELQFLYLPDEKNFEGFSKSEKAHYKQLLLYIAKKFDQTNEQEFDDNKIQMMLKDREIKQRGLAQSFPSRGLPTHTPSIVSYISNLFCFIEIQQKTAFIERMNCNYGYSILQKFQMVKFGKPTKRNSPIISEGTFWKFQSQLHDGLQFQSDTIQQALHAHNKAVFDAVNQVLLEFQPYYSSQGQPFSWSYNFETTFFLISQQNFGALACQIKQKIWEYSSVLAGLILQNQSQHRYKVHVAKLLSTEQQLLKQENKKYDQRVEMEENRTRLLCQISNCIQNQIIKEVALMLFP